MFIIWLKLQRKRNISPPQFIMRCITIVYKLYVQYTVMNKMIVNKYMNIAPISLNEKLSKITSK